MTKLVVFCVLAMAGMACAQPVHSHIFRSMRARHDVALQTNPDSAFWRDAEPAYMKFDNMGNPVHHRLAEVRSRWTKNNLYLLFICPYETLNLKPNPHTRAETNQLWQWDVAEIFIGSDFHNIRRYKEFEMSPQGERVDLSINLDLPHHEEGWTWNSGFQVTARIDSDQKIWYGAMRIPMRSIDPRRARAGMVFRADMFRTEGPAPHTVLNAWIPTKGVTFHVPSRFGRLELVEPK